MGKAMLYLFIYSLLAVMYYLWQFNGIEQAGTVFMFWVWLIGVAGTITLFVPFNSENYRNHSHKSKFPLYVVSTLIVIGTLWAGEIVAATLYAIAILVVDARIDKAKELSRVK